MVYLMKSQSREGTFFKVGYSGNLEYRLRAYRTHNPQYQLLERAVTYKKTKHSLESQIKQEIINLGYVFHVADNGTVTEWFFVDKEHEESFQEKGLSQFKCCKNRKIIKEA